MNKMKKFTLWKKRTPNKKNQRGKYTYFFVKKNNSKMMR